jgi:hypothetical protein
VHVPRRQVHLRHGGGDAGGWPTGARFFGANIEKKYFHLFIQNIFEKYKSKSET